MCPEVVKNEGYGQSVDIWSFGVIVFALLTGKFPFDGRKLVNIYDKIKSKHEMPNWNLFNRFKNNGLPIKNFLQGCLDKDPSKRYTAK